MQFVNMPSIHHEYLCTNPRKWIMLLVVSKPGNFNWSEQMICIQLKMFMSDAVS